ncbi:MAG TPA: class I SAM-dependent methyltransferase [Dehalococcoidia bacterium]
MTAAAPRPRHRWFAAMYDVMEKAGEKRMRPLRQRIVGRAAGRVLEVGCGTGANLAFYDWSKVDSLDATEPDVYMLRRAEAKLAALPAETRAKVRLQEAPAEALPFGDSEFDTAVATLVFCTVADPGRALAEVRRVLKPGGTLYLLEHVAAEGRAGGVQRFVQPVYGWLAAGCQLSRRTEDAVRAAGFDLAVEERTSFGPLWPALLGVATKQS